LVERVEVSYALAAALLCNTNLPDITPIKAFLGIGNPKGPIPLDSHQIWKGGSPPSFEEGQLVSLPGAQREVERISEIIGQTADLLTGRRAKRVAVKSSAGQYCILHFATHAKYDGRRPMWSGLFLAPADERSQNDILRAFEFFNIDLNASLVVMSGCNTGRMEGGGPDDGLVRALQFSGVPAVVASLWTVRDDAALSFMESFYTSLRHGDTKSAALRRAKLELISEGKTDPFFWAGFVLVGDPTPINFDRFNKNQMGEIGSDFGLLIVLLTMLAMTVLTSLKFVLNSGTQFADDKNEKLVVGSRNRN
jgi:CHAT domain-containing protein